MPMQNEGYVWENEVIHDPEDCVKPVIEINIDNLRQLHAATTQGEWECRRFEGVAFVQPGMTIDDWQFCCDIHNAMPALLDELERLRDGNEMLVGALKIASAECDQRRELLVEMVDSMQVMHDMLDALDYPIVISERSKATKLILKALCLARVNAK